MSIILSIIGAFIGVAGINGLSSFSLKEHPLNSLIASIILIVLGGILLFYPFKVKLDVANKK